MKALYINPFIESMDIATLIMLNPAPEGSIPIIEEDAPTFGDVSGLVGLAYRNCRGDGKIWIPGRHGNLMKIKNDKRKLKVIDNAAV